MITKEFLSKVIVVALLVFVLASGAVSGQSPTPTSADSSKADQLQSQIKEYQQKIDQLQGEQKTLNSQIKILDNQVKITELRISETEEQIAELQAGITITKSKIVNLEQDIDKSTKALVNRVAATYEVGTIDPWQILLTSANINNFLTRLKYLRIVQAYDKKSIYASEQAKVNYANQKAVLEEQEAEQEKLNSELEGYTEELAENRKTKEELLSITKSSEKEYQKRLSDALRELTQIQKAAKVLISTEPRQVSRGEAIGLMGSTGYSFGAHLHFGVYGISSLDQYNYYSAHENPSGVLESQTVDWRTECGGDPVGASGTGNGSFAWPMSTGSLKITQGYGHTCYSNAYYRGNPHPAYDMYNNSDIVVRAVEDGKAYFCRNCTGDGANGVFLFHNNGKMTLYWHLQ